MLNCSNCLFSNVRDNGDVVCDKVLLVRGKEIYIDKEDTNRECPSHSDRPVMESRAYFSNRDMRDAEDSCNVCGRRYNPLNKEQYTEIDIQDSNGDNVKITQCSICQEKGRAEKRYGR